MTLHMWREEQILRLWLHFCFEEMVLVKLQQLSSYVIKALNGTGTAMDRSVAYDKLHDFFGPWPDMIKKSFRYFNID